MLLRLVIGKVDFVVIFLYAPQVSVDEAEKERFYDQLQSVVAKTPATSLFIPVGDWKGHVGAESRGFEEVHGGHGFGIRNAARERLLEFAVANDLEVGNTQFRKRESHLVTDISLGHRTQPGSILFRKSFRKAVRDVKIIPWYECVQQHHLVARNLLFASQGTKSVSSPYASARGKYGTQLSPTGSGTLSAPRSLPADVRVNQSCGRRLVEVEGTPGNVELLRCAVTHQEPPMKA